MRKGAQFTSNKQRFGGVESRPGASKGKDMCMKDHKIYKPEKPTKKEREILEQQEQRAMILTMIVVALGAIVATLIIMLLIKAVSSV